MSAVALSHCFFFFSHDTAMKAYIACLYIYCASTVMPTLKSLIFCTVLSCSQLYRVGLCSPQLTAQILLARSNLLPIYVRCISDSTNSLHLLYLPCLHSSSGERQCLWCKPVDDRMKRLHSKSLKIWRHLADVVEEPLSADNGTQLLVCVCSCSNKNK